MKAQTSFNKCVKAVGDWEGCYFRDQVIDSGGKNAYDTCLGCDFYSGYTARRT